MKEVYRYENDISAKKEIQSQSSWFSEKNENIEWKKGALQKKSKRKKKMVCVTQSVQSHIKCVAFSSLYKERISV